MSAVARWVVAKLGAAILVVWIVATLVFFALRLSGDPLEAILGGPGSQAGEETVQAAIDAYALDQPLAWQYLLQLKDIATLQLGDSFARRQPVVDLLAAQLPRTLALAAISLGVAWAIAVTGSVIQAASRGRTGIVVGAIMRGLEIVASVMPQFWLGAVLIMVLSSGLGWLPATSAGPGAAALVMPVITLAIPIAGFLSQVSRDALDDADAAPFAVTARARGAGEIRVLLRHTLRHASLPAIALSGWAFGNLLSGAVVVEVLFARPGLGRLLQEAALARDVPVVIGAVVVVALMYVVVITLTDAIELAADPRLRGRARAHRSSEIAVGT